jgi:hypothetical protein
MRNEELEMRKEYRRNVEYQMANVECRMSKWRKKLLELIKEGVAGD